MHDCQEFLKVLFSEIDEETGNGEKSTKSTESLVVCPTKPIKNVS